MGGTGLDTLSASASNYSTSSRNDSNYSTSSWSVSPADRVAANGVSRVSRSIGGQGPVVVSSTKYIVAPPEAKLGTSPAAACPASEPSAWAHASFDVKVSVAIA